MDFDNRIRLPEGYHLSGGIKETYIIEKYVNAGGEFDRLPGVVQGFAETGKNTHGADQGTVSL